MDIQAKTPGPGDPAEEQIHLQESLGAPAQDDSLPAAQVLSAQTGESDEADEEGRAPLYVP